MAKRYQLAIYDITGKRLCTIYDSYIKQDGAAYDIKIKKQYKGWKELSFSLNMKLSTGVNNFLVDYIKNENLLYLYEDGICDVYCIKTPEDSHASKALKISVSANHISEELKAKNLYKYFDDENGIGTCDTLIRRALVGSGWTLGQCDTF